MLHPSLPPCRAPAQVLCTGPTKPRQQGPITTACAGNTGHPHHTTPLLLMLYWAGIPAQKVAAAISHSKSSSKLKAQAWAGQSATSSQLSSEWPRAEHAPPGGCAQAAQLLTHTNTQSALTHCLAPKTSQHSIPVHPKGTDFPLPPSLFQILEEPTSKKGESWFILAACHSSAQRRWNSVSLLLPNFEPHLR